MEKKDSFTGTVDGHLVFNASFLLFKQRFTIMSMQSASLIWAAVVFSVLGKIKFKVKDYPIIG